MKRTNSILALLLLAVVPLFGEWQGETRISNTSGESYTSKSGGWCIAADADNVHITWQDRSFSNYVRYVGFSIGSSPTAGSGQEVSSGGGWTPQPALATDGSDLHISWISYSYPYALSYRELSDGSWGSIIEHGYKYWRDCYYPALAADSEGNVHCVFNRNYSNMYQVYYQRLDAGSDSFTTAVHVYSPGGYYLYAYRPSICLTSDDNIHVSVSTSSGDCLIYARSTDNGATWSTENVSGNYGAYYNSGTTICADQTDNLYIAYVSYYYPRDVYVVCKSGDAWSTPVKVSNQSGTCYYPSICCDACGNIWVTWQDARSGNYEIYYNCLPAGAAWEGEKPLTEIDGKNSEYPHITGDPYGNVHVCWCDERDGNYEIYYNWFSGVPPKDVAPVSIDAPAETVWSEYTYTPKATVANFTEDTSFTFDVACEFDSAGTIVYADTVTVTDLAGGDSIQVSFADWTAGEADGLTYTMTVITLFEDDTKPANDTISKTVTAIWPPRDVAPVAILTPPDRVWAGCPHIPRAIVANLWESTESFDVLCEFDSAGVVIYSETATVSDLAGGDSVLVEFPSWSAGAVDEFTYLVTVTTLLAKDLTPENDTISKQVAALRAVPDLDIQDYAGNLSANTMQLTGVPNSIVVGAYVMSNPDNWEKNVDLFDGPGNIDLDLSYSCTDLSTYGGGGTIGATNIDPDLNEVSALDLGKAEQNILQVYIPNKAHFETYVGKVTAFGTAEDGSTDADEFTLEVNVVVPKGGGKPSSFSGEPLASGNRLYWPNFGIGEQGFNLYRAESDEFNRLNTKLMDFTEYTDYDVAAAVSYQYKLGLAMGSGNEILIGPLTLTSSENVGLPVLYQNWPNPWMEQTEISYFLPQDVSSLTLKVYDVSGKLVKTLASGAYESGHHSVVWDGKDEQGLSVSSGVYFYRFKVGEFSQTARLVIVR